MKVITFSHSCWRKDPRGAEAALIADSAILHTPRPFFIPDFAVNPSVEAAVAWRVGRLGKNIAERFASRYLDAVAPCWVTHFASQSADVRHTAFDGALLEGDFTRLETLTHEAEISFRINGEAAVRCAVQELMATAITLLADVSRYATLKTGDLIVMGLTDKMSPIIIGDRLEAYTLETNTLRMNIK